LNFPYFFTWTKQKDVNHFEVLSVDEVSFETKEYGRVYDLSSISYQASFGLKNKFIQNSIINQLNEFPIASPKATFELKNRVTKEFLNFLNKKDGKIFYTTGGAESNENAIKMARRITNKKVILSRRLSYHGATLGALSISGDWRRDFNITLDDWTAWIPEANKDPDLIETEKVIKQVGPENIAGFFLETIIGGNGVYPAPQKWWDGIKRLCKKYDLLLILDEVLCGFYRTGEPFGYFHYKLEPDIITFSKGITGGMIPFGAVYVCEKVSNFFEENILSCGLTNYAHPLGLAAMEAVIKLCKDDQFIKHYQELESVFNHRILSYANKTRTKEIRCIGMLAAIEIEELPPLKKFLEKGLYLVVNDKRIILAPNFCYTIPQLESTLDTLEELLEWKK